MATFQQAPEAIMEMALGILKRYEGHKAILDAGVTINFLMAYPPVDAEGTPTGDALKCHGVRALATCKVTPLDQRVLGVADVIIKIDANHWESIDDAERMALLDHELYHIEVAVDGGAYATDDWNRPKIVLRKHDYQFGWFREVASRHGAASVEQAQAATMFEDCGQAFWPEICGELSAVRKTIDFAKVVKDAGATMKARQA